MSLCLSQSTPDDRFDQPIHALCLLALVAIVSSVYNVKLPLHPDEAYYYVMSTHLQCAYFDHPPLTAWMIKLATLWKKSEFWVRLPAIVCMSLGGYQLYVFGCELLSQRIGMLALITYLFLPSIQVAYTIITPDSLLMCFWIMTTRFAYRYFKSNHWSDAIFMGLFSGLALLSKYTAGLLVLSLFLFMLFHKQLRNRLLSAPPYVAFLICVCIFSPVLVWNAAHHWVSILFQFHHGFGQLAMSQWLDGWTFAYVPRFFAHQLGIFHPIMIFVVLWALWSWRGEVCKSQTIQILTWPMWTTLSVFFIAALRASPELNWTGPAYLTAILLFAKSVDEFRLSKLFGLCMVVSLAITFCFKIEYIWKRLPKTMQPAAQFMWYKPMIMKLHEALAQAHVAKRPFIAQGYQVASELVYYYPESVPITTYPKYRESSFKTWRGKSVKQWLKDSQYKKVWFIGQHLSPASTLSFCSFIQQQPEFVQRDEYTDNFLALWGCTVRQPPTQNANASKHTPVSGRKTSKSGSLKTSKH